MGRLPRSVFPSSGVFQVTTRGVDRRPVFFDRDDRWTFMTQLWRAVDRFDLKAHVICLMTNHYHFVVEGQRELISRGMHRLNGVYAEAFNDKYGRSGHLWGDRFALWQIRDDAHLRATCRYVLLNPVRARLCDRAADWEWSWSRFGLRAD